MTYADAPHYFEALPGQLDVETYRSELPPPPVGDNGGPCLEPSYGALERMGRAVHGDLWTGKLAAEIGVQDKQLRRWRDGRGAPTPAVMARARVWALRTSHRLLRAVGEDDLAYEVKRVLDRVLDGAAERGRAIHAENVARVATAAA